jgi:CheY-like chemotaxis protein
MDKVATTRILLVEDEGLIRMIAADVLRANGFDVVEAWDSTEAARVLEEVAGFDVLMTDVQMPGPADGIDIAVHARRRNPDISVLILSGYSPRLKERLDGLLLNVISFAKPYDIEEIMVTLHRLMGTVMTATPPGGQSPS